MATTGPSLRAGLLDLHLIEESIDNLRFPRRIRTWAHGHGVDTVHDLLAWSPKALRAERTLGATTLRKTRRYLEAYLGQSWEEARIELLVRTGSVVLGPRTPWDLLRRVLPPNILELPLAELEFPPRLRDFARARHLETVEALVALREPARGAKGIGRKTVENARRVLIAAAVDPPKAKFGNLFEALAHFLRQLDRRRRTVMRHRMGLDSRPKTLEESGRALGVTRERVRQLERSACASLRRHERTLTEVRFRLDRFVAEGGFAALGSVAVDPWWRRLARRPEALGYFTQRIAGWDGRLIEEPEGFYFVRADSDEAARRRVQTARAASLRVPSAARKSAALPPRLRAAVSAFGERHELSTRQRVLLAIMVTDAAAMARSPAALGVSRHTAKRDQRSMYKKTQRRGPTPLLVLFFRQTLPTRKRRAAVRQFAKRHRLAPEERRIVEIFLRGDWDGTRREAHRRLPGLMWWRALARLYWRTGKSTMEDVLRALIRETFGDKARPTPAASR